MHEYAPWVKDTLHRILAISSKSLPILAMCRQMSIKVSIFSNLVNLDNELLDYIESGTLHVLFKLDSFKPEVMKFLYGVDRSQTILKNYQRLKEAARTNNGTTNIGASII